MDPEGQVSVPLSSCSNATHARGQSFFSRFGDRVGEWWDVLQRRILPNNLSELSYRQYIGIKFAGL